MSEAPELDTCGCCEKPETQELKHYNPPSQKVISYRVGTHAFFMRRMLARLSSQLVPDSSNQPLASLTTRDSDDPSIALLDAWAIAADVLTFYQERIASEGYLRTATERRSVLELARATGYELNPGVAASTFLAFTVEDTPGSPGVTKVPEGTKVQNIPAQGKLPQTFETVEDIEARAEWNALKPRLTQPQKLKIYTNNPKLLVYENDENTEVKQLYFAGTDTKLKEGDLLLIAIRNDENSALQTLLKRIKRITVEYESNPKVEADSNRAIADRSRSGSTRVDFADDAPSVHEFIPYDYESGVISQPFEFNDENVKQQILKRIWKEHDISSFLILNGWDAKDMLKHINTLRAMEHLRMEEEVFGFRQRVGFFGHNAPNYNSLPKKDNLQGDPYPNNWDPEDGSGWEIWKDPLKPPTDPPTYYSDADVYLEHSLAGILRDSWTVFEKPEESYSVYMISDINEASLNGFGISGKVTGLLLEKPGGTPLNNCNPLDKPVDFTVRKTTAHVQSERLELVDMPINDPVEEKNGTGENIGAKNLMLDRMVLDLCTGQPMALSGEQADASGIIRNEIVVIKDISHEGGYTRIFFRDRLKYRYARKTVTINANVVYATHGETIHEVLGSGDGSKANQRFVLKKTPLTYVSAPTPSGIKSTLEVRINDILWEEKPSLYGLDTRNQHYLVRIDDDARAMVIFGDGKSGARLPSGTENIVAAYRSGTGNEGEVGSGSLTLLQTMPLGIKAVTNPLQAAGAKDPEKLEMARINAPRTVLTLDRIVSLRDFKDFARSFGDIGKASAVALRDEEKRLVHITVADENGKTIDSNLKANLVNAIRTACDPVQQVEVGDFIPVTFSVQAKILVDLRYLFENVKKNVERALLDTFTFKWRDFSQPVTAAEVLKEMQNVEGVIAVDLDKLTKDAAHTQSTIRPPAILTANKARLEDGKIQPAELLLLNVVGVTIEKMEGRQ
ncbi:MAG: putative baseplate assembly protein [Methanosarcinales archaeon]|nr:putative baseplate assembly protein [Methanosarcinales archaeon]